MTTQRSSVHAEMMKSLLTVDQARELLATTEPMKPVPFTVGDAVRFRAEPGWNHGIKARDGSDLVGVYAQVGKREYRLTKQTVEEAGLTIGLPRAYVTDCPAELLVPNLNYWFREGLLSAPRKTKDYQFLISDDTAVAFGKQGIRPFSNIALLNSCVTGIRDYFDTTAVSVDYKISHSLRQTAVRLVAPASNFRLDGGEPDDDWSFGLALRNSLLGTSQTSIEGYLFRWICSNGMIDARSRSGVFTRRKDATDDEVNAWARRSVDEVFAELAGRTVRQLEELTRITLDGSLSDTLRDIFEHYRIPTTIRPKIISYLENYDGEITMYVIMNAITQVANESGLEPGTVDSLLRVGGDLPYTASERCGADNPCGRLLHSH